MREHLTPANAVTSAGLTCGFLGLVAVPRHHTLALLLVLLAALLDVLDGVLARRTGGDHTFGAQLDSLSDLTCFCVVPAFAAYDQAQNHAPAPGVAVACLFLVTGAWRLARFPLVRQVDHFVGLPTPAAGVALMAAVVLLPAWPVLAVAVVLGALMVSRLRIPSVLTAVQAVPTGRPHLPRGRRRRPGAARRRRFSRRPGRSSPGPGRPSRERAGRVLLALRPRRATRRTPR